MQRRTFLQSLGVAAALPIGSSPGQTPKAKKNTAKADSYPPGQSEIFIEFIDKRIAQSMRNQLLDANSPFVGGFPNQYGIYNASSAAWEICYLAAGLISPESAYFKSEKVEDHLNLAIVFLLRMQHVDGTIDLLATNFHSPPDTAFVVEPIALALRCVRRHQADRLKYFQRKAEKFLTGAGLALACGGIHTPNHRWVVCMALARIHDLLPGDHLLKRIDQWLAEGIDIDAEGQYTERSTSVYSPIVNRCLLTTARLLERPELYQPVRRNLDLTRFLVRPNGELVTEISHRQDQSQRSLAGKYYYPYCFMARLDNNGLFTSMARAIEKTVGLERLASYFLYRLEDPEAFAPLPPALPLPDNYERHFSHSNIVRIRRGDLDASILADHSTLFTLHKGQAVLQSLRLASSFFGKGQFIAKQIEPRDGGYRLRQHLSGPYVQPLASDLLSGDGDWNKMPHQQRQQSEVQQLTTKITVHESEGQFRIHFEAQGTDNVPWAIELGLSPGGEFSGVTPVEGTANAYFTNSDGFTYQVGNDVIHFSGHPAAHQWTQLRGALPKLDANSVYLTGFTPLNFEL
ncbi:MAG: hypothetical protein ABGX16_13530, partial [Pirellulales bacterium]